MLAGPTAVGKGTVAARGARPPSRDLDLGLGDDPATAARGAARRALLVRHRRGVRRHGRGGASCWSGRSCTVRRSTAPRGRPVEAALEPGAPGAAGDRPAGCAPGPGDDAGGAVRLPARRRRGRSWSAGWSAAAPRRAAERARRLQTAREELAAETEFDVVIVNHEVHAAAEELVTLMTAPLPRSRGRDHHRRLVRLLRVWPHPRRRGRDQPLDRRPADQDGQQVPAGALQRQARSADQCLLLPAR